MTLTSRIYFGKLFKSLIASSLVMRIISVWHKIGRKSFSVSKQSFYKWQLIAIYSKCTQKNIILKSKWNSITSLFKSSKEQCQITHMCVHVYNNIHLLKGYSTSVRIFADFLMWIQDKLSSIKQIRFPQGICIQRFQFYSFL